MTEKDLQTQVKELIERKQFVANIRNLQQIKDEILEENSLMGYPQFPIDSLARKKALSSVHHVLEQLSLTEIMSERANVSLRRDERLHPDFVLFNPEHNSFIILELKTSSKTEREAITELISYEHELQNQFPFLSNYDISFVLIATDYSTLLKHSASSLVTWGNRKLLCLRAITSGLSAQFDIYLPTSWTALGQGSLPSSGLASATICLYSRENTSAAIGDDYVNRAIDLMGEQGDRNNVHGFAFLWKPTHPFANAKYAITVATVNSFAFVSYAKKLGFKLDARIYNHFVDNGEDPLSFQPDSVFSVATRAEQLLSERYDTTWECLQTWDVQRRSLAQSALPIKFRFFGALGDFTTELVLNPETRQFFLPGLDEGGLDPGNPRVAIQILDRLVGINLFRDGCFNLRDITQFGISMGALMTLTHTADPINPKALLWRAALEWRESELLSVVTEIGDRCRAMVTPISDSPGIIIGWGVDVATKISALEAYSRWFLEEFLAVGDIKIYKTFFSLTLDAHGWFDDQLRQALDKENLERYRSKAIKFSRWVTSLIATDMQNDGDNEELRNEVEWVFAAASSKADDLVLTLKRINDDELLEISATDLAGLVDLILPPLFHKLRSPSLTGSNWTWMREQVVARREEGIQNVGIIIKADGTIGIGAVPWLGVWTPNNEEVLVQLDVGGIAPVEVTTWSELKSGAFPRPL